MTTIRKVLCFLAAFALLATAPALMAQQPQMYHVNVDRTQLGHTTDYEQGIKAAFAEYRAQYIEPRRES